MTGWALAVAIAGAVSALIAAGLSAATLVVTGRRETKKWLRDALLDAQVQFLDASFSYPSRQLYGYIGELPPDVTYNLPDSFYEDYYKAHSAQNDALSRIRLLADDDVVRGAERLHKIDEALSMRLFDQEKGFPSRTEWEDMRAEKKSAREAFIKATRNFFSLSDGAPVSS